MYPAQRLALGLDPILTEAVQTRAFPMEQKQRPMFPSPPYSGPLQELSAPEGDQVRVRFACPHCGEILERVAKLDETRWYLPGCSFGHSGVGIHDPSIRRIPFERLER